MTKLLARSIYTASDTGPYLDSEGWIVTPAVVHQVDNLTRRGQIASVIKPLRLVELRELAIDVLDAASEAVEAGDLEALRASVLGWLETADITKRTRDRVDDVLVARDEGRARFGTPRRPLSQERRQVPRKTR